MQSIYTFLNFNSFVYVYLSALIIIGFLLIECYRLRSALRTAIDLKEEEIKFKADIPKISLYKIQMFSEDDQEWVDLPVLRTNFEVTEEAISSLRDDKLPLQFRIVEILTTIIEGSEKILEK